MWIYYLLICPPVNDENNLSPIIVGYKVIDMLGISLEKSKMLVSALDTEKNVLETTWLHSDTCMSRLYTGFVICMHNMLFYYEIIACLFRQMLTNHLSPKFGIFSAPFRHISRGESWEILFGLLRKIFFSG